MTSIERANVERAERHADFWRQKYLEAGHRHHDAEFESCRFCTRAQELLELLFAEIEKARGEET